MARKNSSRRMISAAVMWAAMFIFPFAVSSQSKPLKQIYVGVSSVSMGNIIIYVTKEAKLFEKYGLYADPVAMRGSGESSKAMIGGSIQVAPIATPTVINAGLSGSDLVILGHTLPGVVHAMIVKPEIKRVEDLKGKKVGVTTFGSLTDFLIRHILRKKGLNPDRDVALIQIGGDPERIAALKQGTIDAASLSFPGYGIAMKMGFPMLWDSAKEIDYPWIEITTRRAIVQKDRDMMMNYMKAHLEGTALFKKDREFGKKVIKKVLRSGQRRTVERILRYFRQGVSPGALSQYGGDENQLRIRGRNASRGLESQAGGVHRSELRGGARQNGLH